MKTIEASKGRSECRPFHDGGKANAFALTIVFPDENRDSNRSARFDGVEVTAWLHGRAREAWDGPPDVGRACARVAGRRGAHRSDEAPPFRWKRAWSFRSLSQSGFERGRILHRLLAQAACPVQ